MPHTISSLVAIVALALVCVLGDCCLKRAGASTAPLGTTSFALGLGLYAASAFGWVYVLRHAKLATIGAIFSIVLVICLAVAGVMVFHESLSISELIGLTCAVAALVLLGRFS